MREIVFDTETTGLSPASGDRMVEIGCIELVNRVETGNSFHAYFNPERPMDPAAQEVHGLSDAFLANKPLFEDKVEELPRMTKLFSASRMRAMACSRVAPCTISLAIIES